ncbi:flavodoxin family protein [Chloroflexota bacterium]
MNDKKKVLGLVGSPNQEGRTSQLVGAALDRAAQAGAETELVQMSDYVIEACRDCLPWICAQNLKCTYDDKNFEVLSQKILDCGGLVLGTPVYWGDTSGMVRYLFIKMMRIFARSGQLWGLPAAGIAIAGGSGNGLISGLHPVYHFFQIMRMRALEPLPATRFDFKQALKRAGDLGYRIGGMVNERQPFDSRDECLLWYDNLPYLNESRAAKRRLLATITCEAVSDKNKLDNTISLGHADIVAAEGNSLDALTEVSEVYDSCVKILSEQ